MNRAVRDKPFVLRFERIEDVLRDEAGSPGSELSPCEWREFRHWKAPRRKAAYLASRILAKQLLCAEELIDEDRLTEIEILSRANDASRGTAPFVRLCGRQLPVRLSIAHTDSMVLVGVSTESSKPFGVDLVECSPAPNGFRELWFSAREHAAFAAYPAEIWLRGWAVKEAAFKALGGNSRFVPRDIQADPESLDCWSARFAGSRFDPLPVRTVKSRNHILACTCELPFDPACPFN